MRTVQSGCKTAVDDYLSHQRAIECGVWTFVRKDGAVTGHLRCVRLDQASRPSRTSHTAPTPLSPTSPTSPAIPASPRDGGGGT